MSEKMTLLGTTPVDRRRTLGLIGMFLMLSPIIGLAELMYKLGWPCTDKDVRTPPARRGHPLCRKCRAMLTVAPEPVDLDALHASQVDIACACGWHGTDWIAAPCVPRVLERGAACRRDLARGENESLTASARLQPGGGV